MKKILVLVALFGFGMMVGCDDSTKTPTKTTSTSSTTATSTTSSGGTGGK